jgi:hypothetical protein
MDVWARFHNAVGRGKGLRKFGGTRERSAIFAGAEHGRVPVIEKY